MDQLPDVVEQQIVVVLDDVASRDRAAGGMSNRKWTSLIKDGLCRLGKSREFGVSAAGCSGADSGEWLFDLVWAGGEKDLFRSLELAVECEWARGNDDLLWDFEKLLVAKSIHKLFVYQGGTDAEVRGIADKLTAKVSSFRCTLPGERYLLAGWVGRQRKFNYMIVTCKRSASVKQIRLDRRP